MSKTHDYNEQPNQGPLNQHRRAYAPGHESSPAPSGGPYGMNCGGPAGPRHNADWGYGHHHAPRPHGTPYSHGTQGAPYAPGTQPPPYHHGMQSAPYAPGMQPPPYYQGMHGAPYAPGAQPPPHYQGMQGAAAPRPDAGRYYPAGGNRGRGMGPGAQWVNFSNGDYLKGFLVAAGITVCATNPAVQKTAARGAIKLWSFFQGGIEEAKEKMHDIRAEMSLEEDE